MSTYNRAPDDGVDEVLDDLLLALEVGLPDPDPVADGEEGVEHAARLADVARAALVRQLQRAQQRVVQRVNLALEHLSGSG